MVKEISVERNEIGIVIGRCGHRCRTRCGHRCRTRCRVSCRTRCGHRCGH